jgi:uncharacterized protein YdeI (YjbR/CyaY-like superfamily)
LIYYKIKSGKQSVKYSEAVKEALCFGWIDSKVKSLDEDRYQQIFTPRKSKSGWSKLNKQYIEELIAQGLMTEAGLEKIADAKKRWLIEFIRCDRSLDNSDRFATSFGSKLFS